ncbi:hypothetical protein [Aliikangiella coralliicola]|uniref:Uncharacterized protein n=1 Tax=Aliikangiella coralliicola TaxID=2592383 RepID=A0A545UB09_9GAMM|nr:hypothetical protein [Aliikangiella coralliicola]TQV86650.1 hypothetical protein FLL46_17305 [Aliikangiella coralliicola]
MMKNVIVLMLSALISLQVAATSKTWIGGAQVTDVKLAGSPIFIHLNGERLINLTSSGGQCELWTDDENIIAAAVKAKESGMEMDVRYVADGELQCKVDLMMIKENL